MLRTASNLGPRIKELRDQLGREKVSGAAGGPAVTVELTGLGEVVHIRLAPDLVAQNNVELLEELIPIALNEALTKVRKMHLDMAREATGGMEIPGLQEALASL
ncbi:MAG: YbaB/EbfC family nucleoid-associated protein [Pirellulaceae bacterium]|nr:YbaB/EbfC family nucleoid-associated protein [Pirellulaceae bacterium]